MSNPNPPAISGSMPRALRWIGWLGLAAYAVFLAWNFSPVAGGADSSGYLNSARLLSEGRIHADLRAPTEFGPEDQLFRAQFQPHGFAPFENRAGISPTYAVGLPLHLALAGRWFGWTAGPMVVGVGGAIAAVLLCYAVGRRFGLTPPLAAAGATILAAYPVFVYMSIQPLSDSLAATWCLAAVYFAHRARDKPAWALACGAAFAIAVLVRATNALLLPVLLVLLGANVRRLSLALVGGLPAACWLGYYNHMLYGGAFRSGYVNLWDAFAWRYGPPTALHFLKWLALLMPAALLPLGLIPMIRRTRPTRESLALGLWFGAFFVFYCFYEISHEVWWNLRFVLPGTAPLIIAGLLGLQGVTRTVRAQAYAALALVAWACALGWYWPGHFHLFLTRYYERAYLDAAGVAARHCPPGSLVLAGHHSGSLYFYTAFPVLRWELVSKSEFASYRDRATHAGRAIFALLYDIEEREAFQDHCPGTWTRIAQTQNVTLWRLDSAVVAGTR